MKVNDFRITYSAVEGVPAQMTADNGSLGSLVRPDYYVPRFEGLLKADDDPLLTTPWPYGSGELPSHNYYWAAYIVRQIQNYQGSPASWHSNTSYRCDEKLRSCGSSGRSDRSWRDGVFRTPSRPQLPHVSKETLTPKAWSPRRTSSCCNRLK